jgi:hypothetical protein
MSTSPTVTVLLSKTPPDPDYDPEWDFVSITVESVGDAEEDQNILEWVSRVGEGMSEETR